MKAPALLLASLSAVSAFQPPPKPSFEVASIKPSDPHPTNAIFVGMSADRAIVHYTNIPLRDCIRAAYRVRDLQIDGPAWLSTARFEITARLPSGATPDEIPEMMQQLLEERFHLTFRRETRDRNVYALIAAKTGPKLEPADEKFAAEPGTALGPDGRPRPRMMFAVQPTGVTLTAPSATLAAVSEILSRFTSRPVVDMTGIAGQYRLNLYFAPETLPEGVTAAPPPAGAEASEPAPSLSEAFAQYGLRVERRRAPLEMLVITHIEKTPTEN